MTQSNVPEHAGVRLAPETGAPLHHELHDPHPEVEPIPWKTGKVGVVAGIDAEKQGSRAGEAGASDRSSGFSSRESFSLLSEAAICRFVGG